MTGTIRNEDLVALAHRLRSPLTPLRNAVHLLTLRQDESNVRGVRDLVARQVDQLTAMIDELLVGLGGEVDGEDSGPITWVPAAAPAPAEPAPPAAAALHHPPADAANRRAVVVGDSQDAEDLARRMTAEGYAVRVADDAAVAAALVPMYKPAVAFVDADIAPDTWAGVVRSLTAGPWRPRVFVMTNRPDRVRREADRTTPGQILAKPITTAALAPALALRETATTSVGG